MILVALITGALVALAPCMVLLFAERDRVNDLLRLLEAKAAPAEFAAYVNTGEDEPLPEWLYSEDGLVAVPFDEGDD